MRTSVNEHNCNIINLYEIYYTKVESLCDWVEGKRCAKHCVVAGFVARVFPKTGSVVSSGHRSGKAVTKKKTTQSLRVVWKGLQWNCGSPGVIPECNFEAAQRISSFM